MTFDIDGRNINQEQTDIIEAIREFCIQRKALCYLVAHIRKGAQEFVLRPSIEAVSGTMNIPNKSFNVLSLIRTNTADRTGKEYKALKRLVLNSGYDIDQTDAVIEILKTKGLGGGFVGLRFNKESFTYSEIEKLSASEMDLLKSRCEQGNMSLPY
jgi:hypothetical protein